MSTACSVTRPSAAAAVILLAVLAPPGCVGEEAGTVDAEGWGASEARRRLGLLDCDDGAVEYLTGSKARDLGRPRTTLNLIWTSPHSQHGHLMLSPYFLACWSPHRHHLHSLSHTSVIAIQPSPPAAKVVAVCPSPQLQ